MFPVNALRTRSTKKERMDELSIPVERFTSTFRFIRFINRWFGGIRTTLKGLEILLRDEDKSKPIHILDAGCGCGDMIDFMHRFGRQRGYEFVFGGIDLREDFIALAKRRTRGLDVSYSVKDLLRDSLPPADIVHCAMTLHHFSDPEIISILKKLAMAAGKGLIINDLKRSPSAYLGCWFLTRFVKDPICRADALESIRSGFTVPELETLCTKAGIGGIVRESPWFRLVLSAPIPAQAQ